MNWFSRIFQRRRLDEPEQAAQANAGDMPASAGVATVMRSAVSTRPLPALEPDDALLRFARDYFLTRGARVRVEDEEVVAVTPPGGVETRYTASLARARANDALRLLVPGAAALAELIEDCGERSALTSFRLAPNADPLALARAALAEPPAACGRCASGDAVARCEACPLREGRFALRGAGAFASAREVSREESGSVELTYLLTEADQQGRREQWLRVACAPGEDGEAGAGERRIEPLAPRALAFAQAAPLPLDAPSLAERAQASAEASLAPTLAATGAFLRLRAQEAYQRRLDDLTSTYQRLLREQPEAADDAAATLAREQERLADVYGVEVSAALQRIAFIAAPVARVALRSAEGSELSVRVDLGRGTVEPPACATCGQACRAGEVDAQGRVTCAACLATPARNGATRRKKARASEDEGDATLREVGALTVAGLDALTDESWLAFAGWLLGREGYTVERGEGGEERESPALWRGTIQTRPVVAQALRLPERGRYGAVELRRTAALRPATPDAQALLITTAEPDPEARAEAFRLAIRLLDREALAATLERLESAGEREREATRRETEERIAAAVAARQALLAAVATLEEALVGATNSRRASANAAITQAAATIRQARQMAARALLAWDTLLVEWQAAFGEREARDGSLAILASAGALSELAERGEHLRDATREALVSFAGTPGTGGLGYGAWRKAVLEELTARCEALRWRLLALDPAQAQRFVAARDLEALERAEMAASAAAHAATRAEKAFGQLETQARL